MADKDNKKEFLSNSDLEGLSEKDKELLKYYEENFVSEGAQPLTNNDNLENNKSVAKESKNQSKTNSKKNEAIEKKQENLTVLDEEIGGINNLELANEDNENEVLDEEENIVEAQTTDLSELSEEQKVVDNSIEQNSEETKTNVKQNKSEKKKFNVFNFKSKKTEETSRDYKPPFVKSYKFWVLIVCILCVVSFVGFLIYKGIKDAEPQLPKGFVFETRVNGVFTPKDDLLVYNSVSDSDVIEVRVKFSNNFNGNINLRLSNNGIAEIKNPVISNNEVVRIEPTRLTNSREIQGGLTSLIAEYKGSNGIVRSSLNILIDKELTSLQIKAKRSDADEQLFEEGGYAKKYYVDRDVYLSTEAWFWHTHSPNNDDFGRTIKWESLNKDIATIDESTGKIKSLKAGDATFVAKTQTNYGGPTVEWARITLNFEDIPLAAILFNDKNDKNQTLWLSGENGESKLTIDLSSMISLIPDASVPQTFSAEYMFRNTEFKPYGKDNQFNIKIQKQGDGVFEFYDDVTEHETRDGVRPLMFNVEFGKDKNNIPIMLNTFITDNIFTITIKRNKNFVLTLPTEKSDVVEIQNITIDSRQGLNQYYTRTDLLSLFELQISERSDNLNSGPDAEGNNFNLSKDVVFEAVDLDAINYYSIEQDNGRWYFVPKIDVLTQASNNNKNFRIRAYLKDSNNNNVEIPNSAIGVNNTRQLYIKVVPANVDAISVNMSNSSLITINSGDDVANKIYNNINSIVLSSQISGGGVSVSIDRNNLSYLFNFENDNLNNVKTPYKLNFELTSNDSAVYVTNSTTINLNPTALEGLYNLNLTFYYTYNIEVSPQTPNLNRVIFKQINLAFNIRH